MSRTAKSAEGASSVEVDAPLVNDFQIIVATVNGTGSQTANTALLRALFRMGIPVTGKNIFPSNIQGLPTWFFIRMSRQGYTARRETSEVLVAFNEVTIAKDIQELPPGGACIYPAHFAVQQSRDDVIYYPIPVVELMKQNDIPASLRDYIINMAYVGALAALIGIELEEIEWALNYHFDNRAKPVKLNMDMVNTAYDWVQENHPRDMPYKVQRMKNGTGNMILLDGNSAGALGAVFGGVTLVAWYPITPSTGMIDALSLYMNDMRLDTETGKATFAIIQTEDEIAAIGTVIGAGWAGARAMTATSGPGLSLMSEFAGLAYFAEIPAVVWDVQRVGPSTGLPTRSSQGDVLTAYFLGHGDTKHVCLLPASINECFEFGWRAFDLAERLQTLVIVLSDLDLGMNLWKGETFEYPDQPMDRGKVLSAEDLDRLGEFARYKDVDGDGVAYRTLPGTDHRLAAYFTRGTGHDEWAHYSERPEDWTRNMERLNRKFETARTLIPKPVVSEVDDPDFGLIAYGSTDPVVIEARDRLQEEGVTFSYLRLRALPFDAMTSAFLSKHERIYVVENNLDGQMAKLLCMDYPEYDSRIVSLAHMDGLPLTARWLTETILEKKK